MALKLSPWIIFNPAIPTYHGYICSKLSYTPLKTPHLQTFAAKMLTGNVASSANKVIDSHLHVWASPQEAADKYPYVIGQEPTLPGHVEFLLQMTNEIGKAMFSKAGQLGIPVGFMCMKGLNQHFSEIEELCTEYPTTTVLLDHLGFCKPPIPDEENPALLNLLELSRFPQVHVKLSALFRVSREPFPYQDVSSSLSQVVSSYGANRIMWGSDFPFVVPECGYEAAKTAVSAIAKAANISPSELYWILGGTIMKLFQGHWASS